jgi:hypothetical protein
MAGEPLGEAFSKAAVQPEADSSWERVDDRILQVSAC